MSGPAKIAIVQPLFMQSCAEDSIRFSHLATVNCLLDNMSEGACLADRNSVILDCNAAFLEITGYARNEVIGRTPSLFHSGFHEEHYYEEMWRHISEHGRWGGMVWNRRKNGDLYLQRITINAIFHEMEMVGYLAICKDISTGTAASCSTGLVNQTSRSSFLNRIGKFRKSGGSGYLHNAVCVMDVDDFKSINERYGHALGDRLLLEIMNRLRAELEDADAATRLSGDEFAFVVSDQPDLESVRSHLRRIVASINEPFHLDGWTLRVDVSVGVTVHPFDSSDPEVLIRHADEAMCEAKRAGHNQVQYFDMREHMELTQSYRMNEEVLNALYGGEMALWYQPKVELSSGAVLGVEALLRWIHPENGVRGPDEFLRHVRSRRVLIEIGEWVLRNAVAQIDQWHDAHGVIIPVSVNLVAKHLIEPGFPARLSMLLEEYPCVPASAIEIEILESDAIVDGDEIIQVMHACKNMGITFAMDDFGTGYSSLSQLRRLPVDTLKIDRYFAQHLLEDEGNRSIVEGVVRMAEKFGCKVVAEGVESVEHVNALLELGCSIGQGYKISKPMPADALIGWTKDWRGLLVPASQP